MKLILRAMALCLLFVIHSCQPLEMAVPSVAGLAAYPFLKLKDAFEKNSDDFYEKTLEDRAKKSKELEALKCQQDGLDLTKDMKKILSQLNLKNCVGCKPLDFPACQDESCECSG
jgi:hypothetical protein